MSVSRGTIRPIPGARSKRSVVFGVTVGSLSETGVLSRLRLWLELDFVPNWSDGVDDNETIVNRCCNLERVAVAVKRKNI